MYMCGTNKIGSCVRGLWAGREVAAADLAEHCCPARVCAVASGCFGARGRHSCSLRVISARTPRLPPVSGPAAGSPGMASGRPGGTGMVRVRWEYSCGSAAATPRTIPGPSNALRRGAPPISVCVSVQHPGTTPPELLAVSLLCNGGQRGGRRRCLSRCGCGHCSAPDTPCARARSPPCLSSLAAAVPALTRPALCCLGERCSRCDRDRVSIPLERMRPGLARPRGCRPAAEAVPRTMIAGRPPQQGRRRLLRLPPRTATVALLAAAIAGCGGPSAAAALLSTSADSIDPATCARYQPPTGLCIAG